MATIINLAQDYVGSNNINLLLPSGQFGTRLQGGKDAASPRYIFTQLNPVTKALFPSADENVLRFLYEENQRIEPEWYCPVIPLVLVNGAEGIGTAWSTKIPNYNPRAIVENIRRLINGQEQKPLTPWFKKFTGTITKLDDTVSSFYTMEGINGKWNSYNFSAMFAPEKCPPWMKPLSKSPSCLSEPGHRFTRNLFSNLCLAADLVTSQ